MEGCSPVRKEYILSYDRILTPSKCRNPLNSSIFPSRHNFEVLHAEENEPDEVASRCWRVYHPNVQSFFLLTWSPPAPNVTRPNPQHGERQTSETFHGPRIYRIESFGSRFLIFHLSKVSRIGNVTLYDEQEDPYYWRSPDVDALDSFGVATLLAFARRLCRYMGLPCSSDKEFVEDVHVSMLEWKFRQAPPASLRVRNEIDPLPPSHPRIDTRIPEVTGSNSADESTP